MSGLWLALGIAAAGGLGAAARALVDGSVPDHLRRRFPWGLLVVNLTGSFALGLLTGTALQDPILAIAATGFLGGYTTFSSASFDSVRLLGERRYVAAILNGPGVLLAAVGLAVLGILITGP